MAATSVTGKGTGDSNKLTTTDLAILANGPSIIFTGIIEIGSVLTSPPTTSNTVTFPYPLTGGMDQYVVILTTVNAGYVYISDRDEDSDGNFTSFTLVCESDGLVMYLVAKVGSKPTF